MALINENLTIAAIKFLITFIQTFFLIAVITAIIARFTVHDLFIAVMAYQSERYAVTVKGEQHVGSLESSATYRARNIQILINLNHLLSFSPALNVYGLIVGKENDRKIKKTPDLDRVPSGKLKIFKYTCFFDI